MNTAIITGGNTGLGFECARALAETRDWHVVIACRDAEKGREAVISGNLGNDLTGEILTAFDAAATPMTFDLEPTPKAR